MRTVGTYDKYLMPNTAPIASGTLPPKEVAWEFGVRQLIQTKKIRSSIGIFKNLTGTISGNNLQSGTINMSYFQGGTIVTSTFQGTISQPIASGGTYTNPIVNTGTINTTVINGGTMGTAQINHGTVNPDVYQTSGTPGTVGSIVYIKTVSPGTTFGTLTFSNGIILSFS